MSIESDYPYVLEILELRHKYYLSYLAENSALHDQWVRDGEGFLIMYSMASRSTLDRVERFYDHIIRVKDNEPVLIMLVGNKCDLFTSREVSKEEGMNMARKLNGNYIERSAETCVNAERAIYGLIKMIRQNREGVNILEEIERK
ncbi:18226_t:CDS:2 [Dentiscutata erythropus]|uniref:18226_t:CDS:1 n=1 Tax=Dentiscutata erythropus TaxID=1348616 RepID=A0A9N9F5E8_9GLOM|nr:18226_t:CDS:2 [Dentiscutata erythropus]